MRVLLIKTSSMGDILHCLPGLTDASNAIPGIMFDWVVEEAFQEIPRWHPCVNRIIPIAFRQWRKNPFAPKTIKAWRHFVSVINAQPYDLILDAQGLIKSAFLSLFAKGKRAGLDWHSARERLATLVYQQKVSVSFKQHAVVRIRELFSKTFNYPMPSTAADFNIRHYFLGTSSAQPYCVFLHGTTWKTKEWPEIYWVDLAKLLAQAGLSVKISGGNEHELARAARIRKYCNNVEVLPKQTISQMANLLIHASAVITVDTGFGHLAAALSVPTIAIYGATHAGLTGTLGAQAKHLAANFPCAPCLRKVCHYKGNAKIKPACYETLTPQKVWAMLQAMI
jgi:heptosyltransferase I